MSDGAGGGEAAGEATVNPDGSTTFESDTTAGDAGGGEDFNDFNDTAGDQEGFDMPDDAEEAMKESGIDPAFYAIAAVLVFVLLYYYFVVKRKADAPEDDYFSNLDGEKFNLTLPAEVDEYYKVRAKCEEAGWEAGKGPPPGGPQNASGPHRMMAQALMKRSIADIPLVMHIQKESAGMSRLYSKSMCSVKQWQAYQAAESLVSTEINEVKMEADEIEPGWSEVIWRQATQYHQMLKKKHEVEAAAAQEKAKQSSQQPQLQGGGNSGGGGGKPKGPKKELDAKSKEAAAQRAAEELIKEEEKEKQKGKKAFAGGVKKGFLETKGSKKK